MKQIVKRQKGLGFKGKKYHRLLHIIKLLGIYADPDNSSFRFTEQGNGDLNNMSDSLTIRYLLVDGESGMAINEDGDTTRVEAEAIIVEESYYLGRDEHSEDLMVRRTYCITNSSNSTGLEIKKDYGEQVLVSNMQAFQAEFGLLGVKKTILDDASFDDMVGTKVEGAILEDAQVGVGHEIQANAEEFSVDYSIFVGDVSKQIKKGDQYSIRFNIEADNQGTAEAWEDTSLVVSVVHPSSGKREVVSKINSPGDQVLTYNVSEIFGDDYLDSAHIQFSFNLVDTATVSLTGLTVVKESKSTITWVGKEAGKEIWEEADFISDYGEVGKTVTEKTWIKNKKNVRAIRVTVLAKSPSAKKGPQNYNETYDEIGNMAPFNPATMQDGRSFAYRTYRVVIPVTQNGRSLSKDGIDENIESTDFVDDPAFEEDDDADEDGIADKDEDPDDITDPEDTDDSVRVPDADVTEVYTLTVLARNIDPTETMVGTVSGGGDYEVNTQVAPEYYLVEGVEFAGWEGTDGIVTISGDQTVTALFRTSELTITTVSDPLSAGEVAIEEKTNLVSIDDEDILYNILLTGAAETTFKYGTNVLVGARPKVGYVFDYWYEDDDYTSLSTDSVLEVSVTASRELKAHFTHTFTLAITLTNGGSVTVVDGDGVVYEATSSTDESNDEITENYIARSGTSLTVTPGSSPAFVEWTDNINFTQNTQTVTLDDNMSVTANFDDAGVPPNDPDTLLNNWEAEVYNLVIDPEESKWIEYNSAVSIDDDKPLYVDSDIPNGADIEITLYYGVDLSSSSTISVTSSGDVEILQKAIDVKVSLPYYLEIKNVGTSQISIDVKLDDQ